MSVLLVALTALAVLLPDPAWAWGPVTHLSHGARVLADLSNLPLDLQRLLADYRWYYLYGTIGADIIQVKRYTRSIYEHCHSWRVGWRVLQEARSPEERAFGYGYLSHLAADVYSHNYYLPIQLLSSFPSRMHRHVYWEARFETQIASSYRTLLRQVQSHRAPECDRLVERVVGKTLFSFRTNKRIFESVVRLQHLDRWQMTLRRFTERSRHPLPEREIDRYVKLCVVAIRDLLENGEQAAVLQHDPNGHESLRRAKQIRSKLRALKRRSVPIESIRHRFVDLFTDARNQGHVPEIAEM